MRVRALLISREPITLAEDSMRLDLCVGLCVRHS